jgi:hypothetical protein
MRWDETRWIRDATPGGTRRDEMGRVARVGGVRYQAPARRVMMMEVPTTVPIAMEATTAKKTKMICAAYL